MKLLKRLDRREGLRISVKIPSPDIHSLNLFIYLSFKSLPRYVLKSKASYKPSNTVILDAGSRILPLLIKLNPLLDAGSRILPLLIKLNPLLILS